MNISQHEKGQYRRSGEKRRPRRRRLGKRRPSRWEPTKPSSPSTESSPMVSPLFSFFFFLTLWFFFSFSSGFPIETQQTSLGSKANPLRIWPRCFARQAIEKKDWKGEVDEDRSKPVLQWGFESRRPVFDWRPGEK